jgi:hypothetical protein
MNHPHPDKRHVMCVIRHYLVGEKARRGTARGLGHYHDLLQTYLTAKRLITHPPLLIVTDDPRVHSDAVEPSGNKTNPPMAVS